MTIDLEFGFYEHPIMNITDLRKEMGLTLEEFAPVIGLTSKSHVYQIEQSGRCSVRVALEIERVSEGRIRASDLSPDVALVEQHHAHPPEAAA